MKKLGNKDLVLFFVLAFLLPWAVWGTTIAQQHGYLSWHVPQSLAFWFGLPIATYVTAGITGGKVALKDLLVRLIRLKISPLWYGVALVITPLVGLLSMGLFKLFGNDIGTIGVDIASSAVLPTLLISIWLFLITEETAWRGFALPRLQKRLDPIKASLIIGILWGLWHIPLFLIADSFQAQLPFVGFVISAIATSFIATWIFNKARGSTFLAALFHASTDVAIAYLGVMSGTRSLFWLFVTIQVALAIVLTRSDAFKKQISGNPELIYEA